MSNEQAAEGRPRSSGGPPAAVELYWLPLGAGGHFVRLNGRVYEALAARREGRRRRDLYHAALIVRVPEASFAIEQAPVPAGDGSLRGVVAVGPVGARWAGRFRLFRYEVRRWRDGRIPDLDEAVGGVRVLSSEQARARRLLELLPGVPTLVWGRDEIGAGEMWNSNSVIAWAIDSAGLDAQSVRPPHGGRAPGWRAGVIAARRTRSGCELEELAQLEASLWRAETRFDRAWMEALLADDFREVGRSGCAHTREAVLASEPRELDALPLADLEVRWLGPGVALVSYVSTPSDPAQRALRASIWVCAADGWRLRFHQGTPAPPPGAAA